MTNPMSTNPTNPIPNSDNSHEEDCAANKPAVCGLPDDNAEAYSGSELGPHQGAEHQDQNNLDEYAGSPADGDHSLGVGSVPVETPCPSHTQGSLPPASLQDDQDSDERKIPTAPPPTGQRPAFAFESGAGASAPAPSDSDANVPSTKVGSFRQSDVSAGALDANHQRPHDADTSTELLDGTVDESPCSGGDLGAEGTDASDDEQINDISGQPNRPDDGDADRALVPLETGANALLKVAVEPKKKGKLVFAVAVSAIINALEAIRMTAADLPDGEQPPTRKKPPTGKKLSTAKTPSAAIEASARPCFTMHKGKDHLRLRLQSGRLRTETEVALASAPEACVEEAEFILTDAALFELFAKKHLDNLESKAAPSSPSPEPVIIFEIEQERRVMFVTFGKARIAIKIECTEITAPIKLLGMPATSSDLISTHTLATSLLLASIFKLPPSRSTRQEVSRLNSITCADGAVRGGNGVAFTSVESDQLKPFSFSVHRRDVRALAHLLRSEGKRSFSADQARVQFVDANRVVELEQPELEFVEMASITNSPDATSTECPVQMMAVLDACSIQSAIQLRHDINVPYSTTLAFNGDRDGDLVFRSRSIDGRSEALSRVPMLSASAAQEAVYVTIAFKDFYGALGSARPDDRVEIGLKNRCLIVSLSNGDRTTKHYLPTSLKPPLTACRWEEQA